MKNIFSVILSFIMMIVSLPFAGITAKDAESYPVDYSAEENTILINGENFSDGLNEINTYCGWFNFFGIAYKSDCYLKGTITFKGISAEHSEDFFLEPADDVSFFYSFIDDASQGKRYCNICSVSFEKLTDKENGEYDLCGISTFNRRKPSGIVYLSDGKVKIGADLTNGGALSYLEDLDSNVELVKSDGHIYVDSKASEIYGSRALNKNVNLINAYDRGRLVQQSYYGTMATPDSGYAGGGTFTYGAEWAYNPVQGGNKYNDPSKIVDYRVTEDSIYVKCRPMDWAMPAEAITPSYMEATFTLSSGVLHTQCRFTDFSGYKSAFATQELPAFYCIEPLNDFVWYNEGKENCKDDMIFWPDAGYPNFISDENWCAFRGDRPDSFGIGLYTPGENTFLAGIYGRESTETADPAFEVPTSYVAVVKAIEFKSFAPFEYDYYIATGTTEEIRNVFIGTVQ